MKLLLDKCVTRHLKRDLIGHEAKTVAEAGFRGLENGDLLRAASGKYEVLITVDRNLRRLCRKLEWPFALLRICKFCEAGLTKRDPDYHDRCPAANALGKRRAKLYDEYRHF